MTTTKGEPHIQDDEDLHSGNIRIKDNAFIGNKRVHDIEEEDMQQSLSDEMCFNEDKSMNLAVSDTRSLNDENDWKTKRAKENNFYVETTTLKDIIGHDAAKLRIQETILLLSLPTSVVESVLQGIRSIPASILFYGPPGCGKTQLARAMAGEARAAFISVTPSDILSKFVGESESAVRNLFKKATEQAIHLESKCAIIFFDEIDAIGQSRDNQSGEGEGCSRRVLAELLLQLNMIAEPRCRSFSIATADEQETGKAPYETTYSAKQTEYARIIVVGATNRIFDCDEALKRRFGIQIEVGLPSKRDRMKMVAKHMCGINNNIIREELEYLAIKTENWSGSDIESLSREAAMAPVRECIKLAAVRKSGGSSPSACKTEEDKADERNKLISSLQSLRSLNVQDFDRAISFFTGLQEQRTYAITTSRNKPISMNDDSFSDEEFQKLGY